MRITLAAAAAFALGLVASAGAAEVLLACSDCFDTTPGEVTVQVESGSYRPTTSREEDRTFRLVVDTDAGTARQSFERDGSAYVYSYTLGPAETVPMEQRNTP